MNEIIDKIIKILRDSEPGNHTEIIKLTKNDYDKICNPLIPYPNMFHGPFGAIKIEIK